MLQGKDFGCVLIDEAGQTTELAVLVPLMKMRKDGVVTLVGDHRQLPPTISNVEVDVEGLGTSLFERLSSHGVEPFMLDIQYRALELSACLDLHPHSCTQNRYEILRTMVEQPNLAIGTQTTLNTKLSFFTLQHYL